MLAISPTKALNRLLLQNLTAIYAAKGPGLTLCIVGNIF